MVLKSSSLALIAFSLSAPLAAQPQIARTSVAALPGAPRLEASRNTLQVATYLQTFKSVVKIGFPDGTDASLNAQLIGVNPEFAWSRRGDSDQWGFGFGFFAGTAEIGRSISEKFEGNLQDFDYQADNLKVFGGEISATYLLLPSFQNVALGVKVPVRYLRSSWPVPAAGYSVTPQHDFSVSYLLETRLERERVTWIQNFGFYKKWGNVLWSLGLSYRL
jgi:hypothetical protein